MEVRLTERAQRAIAELAKGRKADPARAKKVAKVIALLEQGQMDQPSLATHRYEDLDAIFGDKVWESYIEHRTPSAWRIWWIYGPGQGVITIVDLGPHP